MINLSHHLGDIDIVTQHLKDTPQLTTFRICGNYIGSEGALRIAKLLEDNQTLQHLDFSCNDIGLEGTRAIIHALQKNTVSNNTAIGSYALAKNTNGTQNTAVGYQALYNTTNGSNTALGANAGRNISTGTNNTIIGTDAVYDATPTNLYTGSKNICIGYNTKPSTLSSSSEIIIGESTETMYIQGGFNMRVGPNITSSPTTLAIPLCQFYVVTIGAVTIQLPIPTSVYRGAQVNFVRHGVAAIYTFQTSDTPSANLYFWNLDAAAASNTLVTGAAISSIMLWCDGTYWNSQFYGII
ncbi:hypothetical protein EBU71_21750 [bacterium]|nr:hypothetical protein [Candidatus Elulimicrobium humile]